MSIGETGTPPQQGVADQARSAAHDAKDAATSAVHDARDAAGNLASGLKDQAEATIGSQKDMAADRVEEVANAVRSSAKSFSGREEWLAGLITEGADELGSLANMLRTNDLRALLGHVENFARRQPTLFTGIAMVAGFAAARVAKSSSHHSSSNHSGSGRPDSYRSGSSGRDSDRASFNRSSSDRSMMNRPASGPSGLGASTPSEPPENYWANADAKNPGMQERGGSGSPGAPASGGAFGVGTSGAINPGPVPFGPGTSGSGTTGTGTSGAASASPGATSYPGVLPQSKP